MGHSVVGDCVTVGASVEGKAVAVGDSVAVGNKVAVGSDVAVGDEVAVGPELAVGDRVGVRQFVTAHHGPDLLVGWFLFWHAVWRNIIATDPYGQLSPK